MMNFLKVSIIAAAIGAGFSACNMNETCYVCTATDPNGVGQPVSNSICSDIITDDMRNDFKTEFEGQHDPASYDISCELK